jgi:hypothetical protein
MAPNAWTQSVKFPELFGVVMSINRGDILRSLSIDRNWLLSKSPAAIRSMPDSDLAFSFRRSGGRSFQTLKTDKDRSSAASQLRRRTAKSASTKGFNIEFDYRFDTRGWFTPQRKAVLEAAARLWERIILDDFPNVPKGRRSNGVINPQTNRILTYKTDKPIDDVRIFVASQNLGFGVLASAGPAVTFAKRYTSANFEPWIGSMAFNPTENWFFDRTPKSDFDLPPNQFDFLSTAAHEIGHVLGFLNRVDAFFYQTFGNNFAGANATALNGGVPLPLDPGGTSHIADGYETIGSGEALMDPIQRPGKRTRPTVLDAAVMDDLGYRVNYNATFRNASAFSARQRQIRSPANARITYARCACALCLMT